MMAAMTSPTASLETTRLRLDPLQTGDAVEMVGVLGSPELYRYTGGSPPTLADLEHRYAIQIAGSPAGDEVWHNWIVRRRTGGAIGFVQATVCDDGSDVAWLIAVEAQGAGCAGEAAAAMIAWLVASGVRQLRAHIHGEHVASQRVAAGLGFVRSGRQDDDGEDIWTLTC
jgi:RimJ/RimL family protein N-acetyltransferase